MNPADISANVEIILSLSDPTKPQCGRYWGSPGNAEVIFSEPVDLLGALYQEQDEAGRTVMENICTHSLSGTSRKIPALLTFGFRFIGTDYMVTHALRVKNRYDSVFLICG